MLSQIALQKLSTFLKILFPPIPIYGVPSIEITAVEKYILEYKLEHRVNALIRQLDAFFIENQLPELALLNQDEILKIIDAANAGKFHELKELNLYFYSAYLNHSQVRRIFGEIDAPMFPKGNRMDSFYPSLLATVVEKGKIYR